MHTKAASTHAPKDNVPRGACAIWYNQVRQSGTQVDDFGSDVAILQSVLHEIVLEGRGCDRHRVDDGDQWAPSFFSHQWLHKLTQTSTIVVEGTKCACCFVCEKCVLIYYTVHSHLLAHAPMTSIMTTAMSPRVMCLRAPTKTSTLPKSRLDHRLCAKVPTRAGRVLHPNTRCAAASTEPSPSSSKAPGMHTMPINDHHHLTASPTHSQQCLSMLPCVCCIAFLMVQLLALRRSLKQCVQLSRQNHPWTMKKRLLVRETPCAAGNWSTRYCPLLCVSAFLSGIHFNTGIQYSTHCIHYSGYSPCPPPLHVPPPQPSHTPHTHTVGQGL